MMRIYHTDFIEHHLRMLHSYDNNEICPHWKYNRFVQVLKVFIARYIFLNIIKFFNTVFYVDATAAQFQKFLFKPFEKSLENHW